MESLWVRLCLWLLVWEEVWAWRWKMGRECRLCHCLAAWPLVGLLFNKMRIPGNSQALWESKCVPLSLCYINSLLTRLPAPPSHHQWSFRNMVWSHMSYLCLKPYSGFLWLFRVCQETPDFSMESPASHETSQLAGHPANPAGQLTWAPPAFLVHISYLSPLLTYVLLCTLAQAGECLTKCWWLGPASWEPDFIVWGGTWV